MILAKERGLTWLSLPGLGWVSKVTERNLRAVQTSQLLAPAEMTEDYRRCLGDAVLPHELVTEALEYASSSGAEVFVAGGSHTLEYVLDKSLIAVGDRVMPRETYLSCAAVTLNRGAFYFDQAREARIRYGSYLRKNFPDHASEVELFFAIAEGINIARVENMAERLSMLFGAPDPEVIVQGQDLGIIESYLKNQFSIPVGACERISPHPLYSERTIVFSLDRKKMIHGREGLIFTITERLSGLNGISATYRNMIYKVTFQEYPSKEDLEAFDTIFGLGANILRRASLAKLEADGTGAFSWLPSREFLDCGETPKTLRLGNRERPVYSLDRVAADSYPSFRIGHLFTAPWYLVYYGAAQDPTIDWQDISKRWASLRTLKYFLEFHKNYFGHRLTNGEDYGVRVAQRRLDNAATMLLSAMALNPQLALAAAMPGEIFNRFSQSYKEELASSGLRAPIGTIHLLADDVGVSGRTVERIEERLKFLQYSPLENRLENGLDFFFQVLDYLGVATEHEPSPITRFFTVWQQELLDRSGYSTYSISTDQRLRHLQESAIQLILDLAKVFGDGLAEDGLLSKEEKGVVHMDLHLILDAASREESLKTFLR